MQKLVCSNCGANVFIDKGGYKVCQFCNSQHKVLQSEKPKKKSEISVKSDVDRLLEKCKSDPSRASRYASLVLDIDPTNEEAMKYL
jgi:uncharacterized Zn finger protein (UPF0148 family)